jgi:S-adenosylmethionine:tRNA ribosyltransferase-isomerase
MTSNLAEARFALPPGSEASGPPEARGLARDEVRMAVVTADRTHHRRAKELPLWLEPGDLLVVNTSATLPSALEVTRHGCTWGLHVSAELDDGAWVVELRLPGNAGPGVPEPGEVLRLPDGVRLRVAEPHPSGQTRLWRATTLRSWTGWPTCAGTGRRSATRTSRGSGRSRTFRTSTPQCPAVPRCRARAGRCRERCWST